MKLRLIAKIIYALKRPIELIKGLSISKKFIILYVVVFAIPIFAYGIYSFKSANDSIKVDFYKQSVGELDKAYDSIRSNIKICENVAQIAKGNSSFLECVNGDMGNDDVALIEFKRKEYSQIVNIQEINPNINAIKFFMDNNKVYELPPVLNKESSFNNQEFIKYLKGLNEKLCFNVNSSDKLLNGSSIEVVSLYWEIRDIEQKHQGFLEVNMLQNIFFNDLYQNKEDKNSLLFAFDGRNIEKSIFNRSSQFFKARSKVFDSILTQIGESTFKSNSTFSFKVSNENFTIICKYVENINTYIIKIYSLDGITEKLNSVRNNILVFIIVAILALCLITYFTTTILMKKINTVVVSMRRVQAGDLSVVIPINGRDEIDELAKHFNSMLFKVKDLISQLLRKQLVAKESEIKALQSQINSHFIYNILESIRMLAEVEQKREIGDAIFSLGKLMRYSMHWKDNYVNLEEEVALVRNYILLINIISDFKVELTIKVDKELQAYKIPKMSIQPLVENAVNHGIEPKGNKGRISITAVVSDNCMVIEIMDNGMGIEEEKLIRINNILYSDNFDEDETFGKNGIGLINVHQRIHLFCGKQYGLIINSKINEFTRVVIRLPYEKSLGGW